MTTPIRLVGFAIAGLIAGLLSCFVPRMQFAHASDKASTLIGGILGMLLPVYLWVFEEKRSWWRAGIFLLASTCAYYAAMTLGILCANKLKFLRMAFLGVHREALAVMIAGGFIGGTILYLAYTLLFCRGIRAKGFFIGWPLTALAGSLLGIVGFGLGAKFGSADTGTDICVLFAVWQSGMACTLGWVMIRAESAPERQGHAAAR